MRMGRQPPEWNLRGLTPPARTTTLAAPRRRATGVAFAAGAAADQRQLAALAARIALIALETRLADLLFHRGVADGGHVAAALMSIAVGRARSVVAQRRQVAAARRGECLGHRLRLDQALLDDLF